MGVRGPAPTPTPILEMRGSWRAKERAGEPRLPAAAPSCPAVLKGEARAEWKRQCRQLERMRVVTEADRAALAAYCEAWGEFAALLKKIADTDYEAAIAKGYVNAKNRAAERVVRYAQQFGFTPAARARVRAEGPKKADDQGDDYFREALG